MSIMGVLILIVAIINIVYRNLKNKSSVVPILMMILYGPVLKIGSKNVDSIYILIIALFVFILAFNGKLYFGKIKRYVYTTISVMIVYTVSWLIFSRVDANSYLSCIAGGMKLIIILIECYTLNYSFCDRIEKDIANLINVSLIINSLFIIFQTRFFSLSLLILEDIFLSTAEYDFILNSTYAGYYTRYNGLFGYPMHLGIFCALAIAFLLMYRAKQKKDTIWLLSVCMALYCGIMSASKSFFIGLAVLYCFYVVENLAQMNDKKKIVFNIFPVLGFVLVVSFQQDIIGILENTFGSYVAYYAQKVAIFFDDFETVFETRLGDSGALNTLYDVVVENFLFGVGPASINGENVMDNAVLVIIHNGGIIALTIVLSYYAKILRIFYQNHQSLLLIFTILACGMGFQIWIASPLTVWICYYLEIKTSNFRLNKI